MRSASQRDTDIYGSILALMRYGDNYRDAVSSIAMARGLTTKGVYGMASRAKSDTNAIRNIIKDFNEDGVSAVEIADLMQLPLDGVKDMLSGKRGDSMQVRGKSTMYDKDGNVVLEWVKTDRKKDEWSELISAALDRIENVKPLTLGASIPTREPSDLLTVIPLADLHIGLHAAARNSTGEWTLERAVQVYTRAFKQLLGSIDTNSSVLLANMGDFTHVDNQSNKTPKSGANLIASGEYAEIVEASIELATNIISHAALLFPNVEVIWQSGNHDEATAVVMQAALRQLYKNTPNVQVHDNDNTRFKVIQWGGVALGFTHGDTVKPGNLPLLMATDYPGIWGDTSHRVWHTGHVHHKTVQEFPGCTVETHGAPVPKDAWHNTQGYRSKRTIESITYDWYGEKGRTYLRID